MRISTHMSNLGNYKNDVLQRLHHALRQALPTIMQMGGDHRQQASAVNDAVGNALAALKLEAMADQNAADRLLKLLTIEYCGCVVSLEYRHAVWPYEYMAFSRRIGELWERFCKTCWDIPALPNVERVPAPQFSQVIGQIKDRLSIHLQSLPAANTQAVLSDIDNLIALAGDISMREDEVFTSNGQLVVIDFKSGFGSNEKGNTLRLLAVAKAYRLYDPTTRLLLLVRQAENNHYLETLRLSGVWEVYCADHAYNKIYELTGANIQRIRHEVINFQTDLSQNFMAHLSGQLSDLTSYLRW